MSRKGYNKSYCIECESKMIRSWNMICGKIWLCPNCYSWSNFRRTKNA